MRGRRAAVVLGALSAFVVGAADAAPAADVPPALFAAALTDDTDVLLLPGDRRPPSKPLVRAATRTRASAAAVAAVALDPAAMRRALPSLVRAQVLASRPGPRPDAWPDRLIAWELEIPLFNLKGRAWLRQRENTVELELADGAFAPGLVRIRLGARDGGAGPTVITCELQLDVQASNFVFRRVARHDPWSETAMVASTAWVLVRALVLAAEGPADAPRPSGPMVPPRADALDARALATTAFAPLRTLGTVVAVRRDRTRGDRLAWVSAAVAVPGAPAVLAPRLAAPAGWNAFPGWGKVTPLPAPPSPGAGPPAPPRYQVDDNVALVDLDATWSVPAALPTRATAVDGDTRGAVLGWDVFAGDRAGWSLIALSMHPRIDKAGFVERRLVAAEPLLEHGLAVALTYVDAAAIAAALDPGSR